MMCNLLSSLTVTQICSLWSRGPPRYSQWTKLIKLITRRTETDLSVMMYVIPTRNLCHWEPASGNLWSCYSKPAMTMLKVSLPVRNDRVHTCMPVLNEMFVLLHVYSSMFVITVYFRPTQEDGVKCWRTLLRLKLRWHRRERTTINGEKGGY